MPKRLGILGLCAGSLIASSLMTGCGGSAPATAEVSAVPIPTSEVDYQKQQDQMRKENMAKNKASRGVKK